MLKQTRRYRRIRTISDWQGVIKTVCVGVSSLAVAFSCLWVAWGLNRFLADTQQRTGVLLSSVTATITDARPRVNTLLSNYSAAGQDIAALTQSFKEQQQAPEAIRHQKNAFRLSTQGLAILADLQENTLPELNQVLSRLDAVSLASEQLVKNTDASFNQTILPQSTKAVIALTQTIQSLNDTAKTFTLESKDVLDAVQVAAVQFGKNSEEIQKILASPAWTQTLTNIQNATGSIDQGLQQFPDQMKSVKTILERGSRYQKISLLVSLLGNVLGVFSTLR